MFGRDDRGGVVGLTQRQAGSAGFRQVIGDVRMMHRVVLFRCHAVCPVTLPLGGGAPGNGA
jgi:hypothetical protein